MKKFFLAALSVFTLAAQQAYSQEVRLKLSDQWPLTHTASNHGSKIFIEAMESAFPDRVKVEHFPAGQLAAPAAQFDAVRNGLADVAFVCVCYVPERFPLSTVAEIPGIYGDALRANKALNVMAANELNDLEFKRTGVRVLSVFSVPPAQLMMRSADKISGLSDLSGKKLRTAGASADLVVQALGAVPVRVGPNDLYLSVQRGTVDGVVIQVPAIAAYKLDEVLESYVTNANLSGVAYYMVMREDRYQALPDDVRAVLDEAALKATTGITEAFIEEENEALAGFAASGKVVYAFDPDLSSAVSEKFQSVETEWIKQMEDRGLPGGDIVASFRTHYEAAE